MQVTHLGLGKSGEYGLGNQMFQIASVIGIAKTNNGSWGFPQWKNNEYFQFKLPGVLIGAGISLREPGFDYQPFNIPEGTPVAFVDGYLQSYKYFEHAEKEVREAFTFKEVLYNELVMYLADASLGNTCSISVRRKDYLHLQHIHPSQPDSYWREAQLKIEEKHNIDTYVVFSDDAEWCRLNSAMFKTTGKKVIVFAGRLPIDDFITISLCKHNIITNSTFSWWGAWLNKNPNKTIVMPKLWFGPQGPGEANDLRVPEWIQV